MPAPKPDKRQVGGTGRSASCKPCNGVDENAKCSCIMDCGHAKCTGPFRTDIVRPSYPHRKKKPGNPTGKTGPRGDLKPPPYDGPRGKG